MVSVKTCLKFLCLFTISMPILGWALSNEQKKLYMTSDLDFIKRSFESSYAPAYWKEFIADWDLNLEIEKAKGRINSLEQPKTKDFQIVLKNFLKSAKDYHVSVSYYSTESAGLPFRVKNAEGKYFFSFIDCERFSPSTFQISVGDELVLFDGKPIEDVVAQIRDEDVGYSNEQTDIALAEIFLTSRSGSSGHTIPSGPLTLTVRKKGESRLSTIQLIWDYTPEWVNSAFIGAKRTSKQPERLCSLRKSFVYPKFKSIQEIASRYTAGSRDLIGAKKSYIPELGEVIWESSPDSSFYAYLSRGGEGKQIGYIRIPHYSGDEDKVEEFRNIVDKFQNESDVLVIDQINNPGGSAFYTYALASVLTDRPLYTPRHRMAISQKDVYDAVVNIPIVDQISTEDEAKEFMGGDTFEGTPVTFQMAKFVLEYFRFIVKEWNEGRTLTEPFYIYGIDQINPHPKTRYTKPILLVVNELDFSCADFFPAILQDNSRAVIFGTRTAGAGGYVSELEFPNLNGIQAIQYTGSLAERENKLPIENLGVQPDIVYNVTLDDVQNGYQGYADSIRNAALGLISN